MKKYSVIGKRRSRVVNNRLDYVVYKQVKMLFFIALKEVLFAKSKNKKKKVNKYFNNNDSKKKISNIDIILNSITLPPPKDVPEITDRN